MTRKVDKILRLQQNFVKFSTTFFKMSEFFKISEFFDHFYQNFRIFDHFLKIRGHPSWKFSELMSNFVAVVFSMRSQWRCFIALLRISSSSGQHSEKSAIRFERALNASHSFRAFGSFRQRFWKSRSWVLIASVSTSVQGNS